jgi:hypothetical protein
MGETQVTITGTIGVPIHICQERCPNRTVTRCPIHADGIHKWSCFDHWGCPTGEQACSCGALRHHPDDRHTEAHLAGHRAYLEDGGSCWCAPVPNPATDGER